MLNNHIVNDETYQLDATIMIYYHKYPLHVSDIYVSIFRSFLYTDCLLLHVVFCSVKNNEALAVMHVYIVCCVVWYVSWFCYMLSSECQHSK